MIKEFVIVWILIVLMSGAVIYGFISSGSPLETRGKKFDQIRIAYLQNLKYSIKESYYKRGTLPPSLNAIESTSTYSKINTKDPETQKEYIYQPNPNRPSLYKLCATFSTSTLNQNPTNLLNNRFNEHPKGDYCFEIDALEDTPYLNSDKPQILEKIMTQNRDLTASSSSTSVNFNDPNIQSVTTSSSNLITYVRASNNKYSAEADFPYAFFTEDPNKWGMITDPAPVSITIKFKNAVNLSSISSLFTPGCNYTGCISWKVYGRTTQGDSILLYEGFAGGDTPTKFAVNTSQAITHLDMTASTTSASEIGGIYWKKISIDYR